MAFPIAKAAPLKPEIRLAQALSEFEAILADDQKTRLRAYRGQSPPNPTDVMRFTAEIDRNACRNRKSRQCVGTRFTNVLHAIQQFSTAVDVMVRGAQSMIASAIWGTVKISLQLASAISSYFDQLSTLFMRIGRTCPRYQDFGLLYPESTRLQSALCEYFAVIVHLCKQAVLFLNKRFRSQLLSSILKPFELEFGGFYRDLENLASGIRDELSLASKQAQQIEATEMSKFRALGKKFADTSAQDLEKARTRKRKKAELLFLNACSVYNHEKYWKQARKQGNANWICHDERYKQWKQEKQSSTLWCTGILGSGKTVLSANVVEDLKITTPAVVAYFFCKHDEVESLQIRTIIGSIARQIFDHVKPNLVDTVAEFRSETIDTDQVLSYIQRLLPSNSHKYFIIIDGLDECEEKETRMVLQCLNQLLTSKQVFRVYCSSRPNVFHWTSALLKPQWNVFMSQTSLDMVEYIESTLEQRLESESFFVGNPAIILTIRDALLEKAHGMFLWVAFQIESICSQKTDAAILTALEDLPKDLPETFNRILRKLQHSNTADPYFCQKIFDVVAAAQRPLALEELREAISVEIGKTKWDANKLVNEIHKSLLDSCGSLITVDEEHLTVHFAHHSVKQHLLSEPIDSNIRKYHIDMEEADLYLGNVIVTYLNYDIFESQLTKAYSTTPLPYPSAIVGNLSRSKIANKLAVKLLKSRGDSRFDIHSHLAKAAEIVDGSKEQNQSTHCFLSYAQEYWLFHTKAFIRDRVTGYTLWQRLADGGVNTVKLPWEWTVHNDEKMKMIQWMKWSLRNHHWALIDRILVKINGDQRYEEAAKPLLEFLEKNVTNMDILDKSLVPELFEGRDFYLSNRVALLLSLKRRADISVSYEHTGNALQAALRSHHEEIARLLLKKGVDINTNYGLYGNALHAASTRGHGKIARLLLENGADVNAQGEHYGNALQAASAKGHKQTISLLLENGADVNALGGNYGSALKAASANGQERITRLLLENGADVNALGGHYDSALKAASANGQERIARLLLENGADVHAQGGIDGSALRAASANGQERIAKLLLENGADVNAKDGHDGSALQAASEGGYEEVARLLLNNGADVDVEGGFYGNALQAASAKGQERTARLLLENGADVNALGGHYGSALQAALEGGYEEVARLLLKNGADVNIGNALQAASAKGQERIAKFLLENGADVNIEGGHYGNALQAASENGHRQIARLLLENGAIVNDKTVESASRSGFKELETLIRNAWKSQSSSVSPPSMASR